MGWLWDNPSDESEDYLSQIPSELSQTLQPYINAGTQALPYLQQNYNMLSNLGQPLYGESQKIAQHPVDVYNAIGSQYEQSPAYQWQYDQSQQAAENAANAGGYAGDPEAQQYSAEIGQDMANKDFYNWMGQVLGVGKYGMGQEENLFNTGIGGEQSLYNTGANEANQLAEGIAQALMAQATNAYSGQENQNERRGFLTGAGIGGLAGALIPKRKKRA